MCDRVADAAARWPLGPPGRVITVDACVCVCVCVTKMAVLDKLNILSMAAFGPSISSDVMPCCLISMPLSLIRKLRFFFKSVLG